MPAITPAASVLLARGPGSRELFAVRRGAHLKFFGGFWAFPGGRLDPGDVELAGGDGLDARRVAACRELFEEAGVLLARRPDGSFVPPSEGLNLARRDLLDGNLTFAQFLHAEQLYVRPDDLRHVGQLTTPPFSAQRFATTFFLADAPPHARPEVWPGELDEGRWVEPADLLADWTRGTCLLTPPTVTILQALAGQPLHAATPALAASLDRQSQQPIPPIFFAPGVQIVPLRTAALPPLAYTNAYLVGTGPRYMLDPGPDDPAEQRRLFDVLDAQPVPLTAVVLTHHHRDHLGAAAACAERYGVPVWAHPLTAECLQGRVAVERLLQEGDRLDLGVCPADGQPWSLDVLHTPGHAPGHLAFFEPCYRLLFVGDLVSTVTSVVIAPPDGDLAVYLESLRRLREWPARLLLPAHGNASAAPGQTIGAALEHRAKREQQLLEALAEGPAELSDLVPRLYRGLPDELLRFARSQVLAGLLKLQREGRTRPAGDECWERID